VAAPLLAGFSFTSVIAISAATEHFRWPGLTVLALALAAILMILAVQSAKYADPERRPAQGLSASPGSGRHWPAERWQMVTRNSYHAGLVFMLLGLAFALAPKQAATGQDALQWAASWLAFGACTAEFLIFITHLRTD
jgi:hypothetical protein